MFVFDVAAQCGLKICCIGTIQAELLQNKVEKHIRYDTYCHENDETHCDIIADLVRSEFGEVDGCITFRDDCITLTALLCQRLKTPGLPYSGAVAAKKKSLTLEKLKTSPGISRRSVQQYCSRCCNVVSLTDLEKSADVIGFPAVLKGEYGCGGISFKIVHDIDESREHFSVLQSSSSFKPHQLTYVGKGFGNECVLMELLEGSEHCVDLVLFHGELLGAFITDKGIRTAHDTTVHSMSVMPSVLSLEKQNEVIRAAFECCLALGLDHGILNVDTMLTHSGPKLIEINARMAGYCQRDFIQVVYNMDLVRLAFQLACDIRPDIPNGHCFIPSNCKVEPSLPSKVVSSTDSEINDSECSNCHFSCLNDSRDPPTGFAPNPSCVIVGRTLYGWQHGLALRTTARPEILQQLHQEEKLLLFPIDEKVREECYNMPFCKLAVTGDNFSDATDKMEQLCQDLRLEPVHMLFSCNQESTGVDKSK
ncbi:hypothetical protein ACOMHN_046390 [Nucella lapillus]